MECFSPAQEESEIDEDSSGDRDSKDTADRFDLGVVANSYLYTYCISVQLQEIRLFGPWRFGKKDESSSGESVKGDTGGFREEKILLLLGQITFIDREEVKDPFSFLRIAQVRFQEPLKVEQALNFIGSHAPVKEVCIRAGWYKFTIGYI